MATPSATRFAADTHCGRKYQHNEDSIGCDPAHGLFLVADGMGGHASGEVASRIVKETLLARAVELPLDAALLESHRAVVEAAASNGTLNGMGSTGVVARLADGSCELAWVGDSRAYLFRRRELKKLTRDHSLVELLLDQGKLGEEGANKHPDRHVLTQTLGIAEPVPSLLRVRLRRGDRLLLCSDGLNDELTDDEIAKVLRAHADPGEAVSELIRAALANGGRDNVSVIVVEPSDTRPFWQRLPMPELSTSLWLPVLIGCGAAVLLIVLWYAIVTM